MPINEPNKRPSNDSLVPFVAKKPRNNEVSLTSSNQSIIESVSDHYFYFILNLNNNNIN